MNPKYTKPRGTQDLFYENIDKFNSLCSFLQNTSSLYGFKQIKTPIFENKNLFIRSVGEESNIVTKEFYDFQDKSGREMALRPEGTAPVIRAVIENKLIDKYPSPLKLSYLEPMFRYERPQSGRLRQFHQFGVEVINTSSLYDEIELLILVDDILNKLKIKKAKLNLNNIGSLSSRKKWINELSNYFHKYEKDLSSESKKRIDINPLRILDDNDESKKTVVINAPKIDNFLSNGEKKYFENILDMLNKFKINYVINKNIVRGLDYYSGLVFEVISNLDILAGQPTIIGGGKYVNLVSELGGKNVECIGFAIGIERLLLALNVENNNLSPDTNPNIIIGTLDNKYNSYSLFVSNILRKSNFKTICNFNSIKIKNHFSLATKLNAEYVIIIGQNEFKNKTITIKNQKTLIQKTIDTNNLLKFLNK